MRILTKGGFQAVGQCVLGGALCAALWVAAVPAGAAPGFLGPSGFMFTPDGTNLPKGCASVGYHHFEVQEPESGDVNSIKANVGLSDRLELGVAWFDGIYRPRPRGGGGGDGNGNRDERDLFFKDDEVFVNAKFALLPLRRSERVQLIAGVIDAFDQVDRTPYVYASANLGDLLERTPVIGWLLPSGIQFGAGWATGLIEGPFVNASLPVGGNVTIAYEFLDNHFPGYGTGQHNLGARVRMKRHPRLALDAGMTNFDDIFFGASYSFCPLEEEEDEEEEEKGKEWWEPEKGKPAEEGAPGAEPEKSGRGGPSGPATRSRSLFPHAGTHFRPTAITVPRPAVIQTAAGPLSAAPRVDAP